MGLKTVRLSFFSNLSPALKLKQYFNPSSQNSVFIWWPPASLKYFRSLRYPGIIGPGFRTPSLAQYASLLIEESVKGRPVKLKMAPDSKFPLLYFKDAAMAMIKLAQSPESRIKMVNE